MYRVGEGTKILRDMRKGKSSNATKKLNTSRFVNPGNIISHVAQGILKDSRKIKTDHVIWQPDDDREENRHSKSNPTMTGGGQFGYSE